MNLSYLRQTIAHQGLRQVAIRYTFRSVERLVDVSVLRCLLLREDTLRQTPVPSSITCRRVEPEELLHEATITGSGLRLADVEQSLRSGEECFGAFVDGTLASYLWFSPSPAHLQDNIFVHFDPSYAYSRWAFTRPEFRGQRLYALCKQNALKEYSARGRRGIASVVYTWNTQSLNAASQLGCVTIGSLVIASGKVWTSRRCRAAGLWLETSSNGQENGHG